MRSTIHTPDPEVLEFRSWDVTPRMERVFSSYYNNLKEHLKEYHEAKWLTGKPSTPTCLHTEQDNRPFKKKTYNW